MITMHTAEVTLDGTSGTAYTDLPIHGRIVQIQYTEQGTVTGNAAITMETTGTVIAASQSVAADFRIRPVEALSVGTEYDYFVIAGERLQFAITTGTDTGVYRFLVFVDNG